MRKLVALVVVAALVAGYLIGDSVVRSRVERALAARIEARVAGTAATVSVPSVPFTGYLAVAGDVPTLRAHVTGVRLGAVAVDHVDLAVDHLGVDRGQLLSGHVRITSVRSAAITAVITQQDLAAGAGLPVTLGDGTVGLAGAQVPVAVTLAGGRLRIKVTGLPAVTLPLLPAALLPCDAVGRVVPGALVLSCTTATLPAALVQGLGAA